MKVEEEETFSCGECIHVFVPPAGTMDSISRNFRIL